MFFTLDFESLIQILILTLCLLLEKVITLSDRQINKEGKWYFQHRIKKTQKIIIN